MGTKWEKWEKFEKVGKCGESLNNWGKVGKG